MKIFLFCRPNKDKHNAILRADNGRSHDPFSLFEKYVDL